MVLNPKETTLAYRCPHCGAGVMSIVGLFTLTADMLKLKCDCGKSELTVVYSDGKVRLTEKAFVLDTVDSISAPVHTAAPKYMEEIGQLAISCNLSKKDIIDMFDYLMEE